MHMGKGKGKGNQSAIVRSLERLVNNGWLPLRHLSMLLGYSHATGIYDRQRHANAVPTVRIGGQWRVYEADILQAIQELPPRDQDFAQAVLTKYRQLKKEHVGAEGAHDSDAHDAEDAHEDENNE